MRISDWNSDGFSSDLHTAAMCSASRAALLTGRNPARVGMSGVTNSASSHPAYTTILPKSAATIARILRDNGYNTAMVGKAHITPKWETGPTGPFDRWQLGRASCRERGCQSV